MMRFVISLLSGLIFGLGLLLSQMVTPAVVIGFLDIFGEWNPALIFVLSFAVLISVIAWKIRKRIFSPVFGEKFPQIPLSNIDRKLIIGSVVFGMGWGMVGICPGPSLILFAFGTKSAYIFLFSMAFGMIVYDYWISRAK